jgi:hypothetical protein
LLKYANFAVYFVCLCFLCPQNNKEQEEDILCKEGYYSERGESIKKAGNYEIEARLS